MELWSSVDSVLAMGLLVLLVSRVRFTAIPLLFFLSLTTKQLCYQFVEINHINLHSVSSRRKLYLGLYNNN